MFSQPLGHFPGISRERKAQCVSSDPGSLHCRAGSRSHPSLRPISPGTLLTFLLALSLSCTWPSDAFEIPSALVEPFVRFPRSPLMCLRLSPLHPLPARSLSSIVTGHFPWEEAIAPFGGWILLSTHQTAALYCPLPPVTGAEEYRTNRDRRLVLRHREAKLALRSRCLEYFKTLLINSCDGRPCNTKFYVLRGGRGVVTCSAFSWLIGPAFVVRSEGPAALRGLLSDGAFPCLSFPGRRLGISGINPKRLRIEL